MKNYHNSDLKLAKKATFEIYHSDGVYLFVESKAKMQMCLFMPVISIPSWTSPLLLLPSLLHSTSREVYLDYNNNYFYYSFMHPAFPDP